MTYIRCGRTNVSGAIVYRATLSVAEGRTRRLETHLARKEVAVAESSGNQKRGSCLGIGVDSMFRRRMLTGLSLS